MVKADAPVTRDELERLVHEYRHVHDEHRRARRGSRVRRHLGSRLEELRLRFEHVLAATPVDDETRRRWRDHLRHRATEPEQPAGFAPLLFLGRSDTASQLRLTAREDGTIDAAVDGTTVALLDAAEELDSTEPPLGFRLDESVYYEEFATTPPARVALRASLEEGLPPTPPFVAELLADGLVDRRLDVTPRGRRALALDLLPAHPLPAGAGTVSVHVRGSLPPNAREGLEGALARLARLAPRPLLHARATLERLRDPALERPFVAKARLELAGRAVRAHTAAPSATEAISQLETRLRRVLLDVGEREETARREGRPVQPGTWRHGDLTVRRPARVERPRDERRLVRQPSFAAEPMTPEEAVWELRLLDLEFHLFTDSAAHEEAVVYVRDDGTPGLKRIEAGGAYVEPFVLDPEPAPTHSSVEAIERLDASREPFLFFVERASGRGSVLYRRDDGHYGLVVPSEQGD